MKDQNVMMLAEWATAVSMTVNSVCDSYIMSDLGNSVVKDSSGVANVLIGFSIRYSVGKKVNLYNEILSSLDKCKFDTRYKDYRTGLMANVSSNSEIFIYLCERSKGDKKK